MIFVIMWFDVVVLHKMSSYNDVMHSDVDCYVHISVLQMGIKLPESKNQEVESHRRALHSLLALHG